MTGLLFSSGPLRFSFGTSKQNGTEILSDMHHTHKSLPMEQEVILEMSRLLEKTGIENLTPMYASSGENKNQALEATLINVKTLQARYEKQEALSQIQWLMNKYNIQIDELMERIPS